MTRVHLERVQIALGLAVIIVVASLITWGGSRLLRFFISAPDDASESIALSAFFDTSQPGTPRLLRVVGTVQVNGERLKEGRALVKVHRLYESLDQSVVVDVRDGQFDTRDQPAFQEYGPDDPLHIEAEISAPGTARLGRDEIYLKAFPPVSRTTLRWTVAGTTIVSLWFFWAFTGIPTALKNRAAIIFSYCAMVGFLALPFAAFYVLGSNASVEQVTRDVTWKTPVGVLQAVPRRLANGLPATDVEREWVVHIGGAVIEEPIPEARSSLPNNSSVADGTTSAANQSAGEIRTEEQRGGDEPLPTRIVIEGGLVIPLYVFVLSIIGGSINMTRRLPQYQREAEELRLGLPIKFIRQVGGTLWTPAVPSAAQEESRNSLRRTDEDVAQTSMRDGIEPGESRGDNSDGATEDSDAASQPTDSGLSLYPDQPLEQHSGASAEKNGERHAVSKTESVVLSPEQRSAEWRQGLIMQHMYLISAPFLAIAVFYLLDWLDLRKKPLLVLVALSVGLVSDKILRAILGVVVPILEQRQTVETTESSIKTTPAASTR